MRHGVLIALAIATHSKERIPSQLNLLESIHRIHRRFSALAYEYYYPDDSLGDGVNIYIVGMSSLATFVFDPAELSNKDTGVQITHVCFLSISHSCRCLR